MGLQTVILGIGSEEDVLGVGTYQLGPGRKEAAPP